MHTARRLLGGAREQQEFAAMHAVHWPDAIKQSHRPRPHEIACAAAFNSKKFILVLAGGDGDLCFERRVL